jgi:hypothetical protein
MSRLGNADATVDERASVLVSHAGTRPRAAVATPDPAHTIIGARQLDRVRHNAPCRSDALWRVRGAARASEHMVRTHGRGQQPSGVRRLLPRTRRRTLRATGTAHVHPQARRAISARTEERPTTKTTVCLASGTTTRQTTSARARSSPMRGPGLAQLSRRRTPRIQEEALVGSNRTWRRAPSGSDALCRPHALLLCVRAYTWCVRTHGRGLKPTNAPSNQAINLRVQ